MPEFPLPWMDKFIYLLSRTGNVKHCCESVGISYNTVKRHRREKPDFAKAWEDALEKSDEDSDEFSTLVERMRDLSLRLKEAYE